MDRKSLNPAMSEEGQTTMCCCSVVQDTLGMLTFWCELQLPEKGVQQSQLPTLALQAQGNGQQSTLQQGGVVLYISNTISKCGLCSLSQSSIYVSADSSSVRCREPGHGVAQPRFAIRSVSAAAAYNSVPADTKWASCL